MRKPRGIRPVPPRPPALQARARRTEEQLKARKAGRNKLKPERKVAIGAASAGASIPVLALLEGAGLDVQAVLFTIGQLNVTVALVAVIGTYFAGAWMAKP